MDLAEVHGLVRSADADPRRVRAVVGLGARTELVFREPLRPGDLTTGHCPPGSPLVSFRPVVRLIEDVLAALGPAAQELVEHHREGLRFLDPALVGEDRPRVSPLDSHAVAYAIVRRISRESLYAAVRIDQAARFLLTALRTLAARPAPDRAPPRYRLPGDDGRLTLWVPDADLLDRPSLRLLNRLHWLCEPADPIELVMLYRGDPLAPGDPPPDGVRGRLARARARLFERLHQEWRPATVRVAPAGPLLPEPLTAARLPPRDADPVAAVAENLVDHNYDRAYLLAELLLARNPSPSRRADLLRLTGLCDANIGESDLALASLDAALDAATEHPLRAHLHYLRGLLHTKRRYDLTGAEHEYRLGLAELDAAPRQGPEEDFERAWLLNGQGLVNAMRARALDGEARRALLHDVLRQETAAFRLARSGAAPRNVYLRHNLLANTAFVLEMLGTYDGAIEFWGRAFGPYLDRPGSSYGFEAVYRYRVGLLQWRAGRPAEARESLRTALRLADDAGDRFQAERISYALSFVLLDGGDHPAAIGELRSGLRRAWRLRDPLACREHAGALLLAAERAGRPRLAAAVLRWLRLTGHPALAAEAALPAPRPPAPKLPAYLPGIDLEPTPEVNLNVYLADPAPQAAPTPAADPARPAPASRSGGPAGRNGAGRSGAGRAPGAPVAAGGTRP